MKHSVMSRLGIILLFALTSLTASAQCSFRNTAFKPGEFLSYNLYYNWKIGQVRAGTASLYVVQSHYRGQQAYRASLTTRGNRKVDDFFILRDTLLCYNTLDLAPLYFRKGAREGDRYTVDEVFYKYTGSKCQINQHRLNKHGEHEWKNRTYNYCVYDMLSIFLRARSFDPSNWVAGKIIDFPIADGNSVDPARLRFRGKTNVKADNGHKYRCLELSYMEKQKGKYKEVVRFYVTDDSRHIPIRLDLFLRFGYAKALLSTMKGTM